MRHRRHSDNRASRSQQSARPRARLTVFLLMTAVVAGCVSGPNRPPLFVGGEGPTYPAAAKAGGVEGYVELVYDVAEDGTVQDVDVVAAEPPGVFEAAAVEAVKAWRYKPMVIKGEVRRAERVRSVLRFEIGEPEHYEDL